LQDVTLTPRLAAKLVVEVSDMEQSPHNPSDEFFQMMFSMATRQELIELRQCLVTEHKAAFNANDVIQVAVIESLFDRIESLLKHIEQREVRTAIHLAEFSGVN
jgi:hypothetical protein